jgi:hypothetical protein
LGARSDATAALDPNRGGTDTSTVEPCNVVENPMLDGEVIHRATIRAAPR